MTSNKRSLLTLCEGQSNSIISPFYKEVKLNENSNPGTKYFKMINEEEKMTEKEKNKSKKKKIINNINVCKSEFLKTLKRIKFSFTKEQLELKIEEILDKIKYSVNILNIEIIEMEYLEYSSSYIHRKNYKKKNWNEFETNLFIFLLASHSLFSKKHVENFEDNDWNLISSMIIEKDKESCKFKWNSMQKSFVVKSEWTDFEDECILKIYSNLSAEDKLRPKWSEIAKDLNKMTGNGIIRLGKHIRERYLNHLNPELKKGEWSYDEDLTLLTYINQNGKKWAEISKILKVRNENAVKNRFLSLIKPLIKGKKGKARSLSPSKEKELVIKALEALKSTKQLNTNYESQSPSGSPRNHRLISPLKIEIENELSNDKIETNPLFFINNNSIPSSNFIPKNCFVQTPLTLKEQFHTPLTLSDHYTTNSGHMAYVQHQFFNYVNQRFPYNQENSEMEQNFNDLANKFKSLTPSEINLSGFTLLASISNENSSGLKLMLESPENQDKDFRFNLLKTPATAQLSNSFNKNCVFSPIYEIKTGSDNGKHNNIFVFNEENYVNNR